jgi:hypothetical protein
MRILEPDRPVVGSREVQITIDLSERYAEVVEVHRMTENGLVLVQVTSAKVVEPHADHRQNFKNVSRRLIS